MTVAYIVYSDPLYACKCTSPLHLVEKKKDIKSAISAIEKVEDANMKLELYRQLGKDLTDGI